MIARKGFPTDSVTVQEERQNSLKQRDMGAIGAGAEGPVLAPRTRQREIPLSYSQQRLWFLDQLAPGSPVYNVPEALRLNGPLSAQALEQSFTAIIRRHEALRTTFQAADGNPVQVIAADFRFKLTETDLSHLEVAAREEEVKRLALDEAKKAF